MRTKTFAVSLQLTTLLILLLGCKGKSDVPANSSSRISMDKALQIMADENRTYGDRFHDVYDLVCAHGPKILESFDILLESSNHKHRRLAGDILQSLTSSKKWPEAYSYIKARLMGSPNLEEVGQLLRAISHEGIHAHRDIAQVVSRYLDAEDVVANVFSNSYGQQEFRVCDYACFILQTITQERFGAEPVRIVDSQIEEEVVEPNELPWRSVLSVPHEAVLRARKWAAEQKDQAK